MKFNNYTSNCNHLDSKKPSNNNKYKLNSFNLFFLFKKIINHNKLIKYKIHKIDNMRNNKELLYNIH